MKEVHPSRKRAGSRDLMFFATPRLWPQHPFLPLIRHREGLDSPECGVLYDARGVSGLFGYSATVFLVNLYSLPRCQADLLAGPRLVYDSVDELAQDGWVVD